MPVNKIPYSYRSDRAVPACDDTAPILIFDDVCVLCSAGVFWMIRRTPDGNQKFMSVKAPLARALYALSGKTS